MLPTRGRPPRPLGQAPEADVAWSPRKKNGRAVPWCRNLAAWVVEIPCCHVGVGHGEALAGARRDQGPPLRGSNAHSGVWTRAGDQVVPRAASSALPGRQRPRPLQRPAYPGWQQADLHVQRDARCSSIACRSASRLTGVLVLAISSCHKAHARYAPSGRSCASAGTSFPRQWSAGPVPRAADGRDAHRPVAKKHLSLRQADLFLVAHGEALARRGWPARPVHQPKGRTLAGANLSGPGISNGCSDGYDAFSERPLRVPGA